MNNEIATLITKIIISAFAATGLIEFLKNIIKSSKTWIFTIIMPFIAAGCFCICQFLPAAVIGSILTIGMVQLCYQVLVQGFKKIVSAFLDKVSSEKTVIENTITQDNMINQ